MGLESIKLGQILKDFAVHPFLNDADSAEPNLGAGHVFGFPLVVHVAALKVTRNFPHVNKAVVVVRTVWVVIRANWHPVSASDIVWIDVTPRPVLTDFTHRFI